jgi:hypothetical protein
MHDQVLMTRPQLFRRVAAELEKEIATSATSLPEYSGF